MNQDWCQFASVEVECLPEGGKELDDISGSDREVRAVGTARRLK
jgi:hypothetical protein